MIFLCGIPSEPSLGLVCRRLDAMAAPYCLFHQRHYAEMAIEMEIAAGQIGGWMRLDGQQHRLADFDAVYTRLMDYRLLPEVERLPEDSPERSHCQNVHACVMQWYEIMPGRVLNRSTEVGSNYSKPCQSQVIRECGFAVPETLVTNDADAVREFRQRHGQVIYKSVSYERSIVALLDDEGEARLSRLRACPVQFQQYVAGDNLRVHTVGERAFATRISAATVDYRYAYLDGEEEALDDFPVGDDLAEACVRLARGFGLEFAGIDLKLAADGGVYCLEVNPSPAFSYYELHTGQPISQAVAAYLAGTG